MANVRLSELTEITEVEEGDYFIVIDSSDSNNTKKVNVVNKDEQVGVYGYVSTPVATDITTADTYYRLAGTFTNPVLEGFSIVDDKITYQGTNPIYVEIQGGGSFTSDTNNVTIDVSIKINDTVDTNSTISNKLGLSGSYGVIAGTSVLEIENGDSVEIVVKSDKICELTAQSFTVSLHSFF